MHMQFYQSFIGCWFKFCPFQRIEQARADVAEIPTNAVSQANLIANQPNSNAPNEETMDTRVDESVVLPPPPGFN